MNTENKHNEMIEGLVEDTITINEPLLKPVNISLEKEMEWNLPNGYIFKDENGNVINATKIVLEKKKEYPKTYEECCKILGCKPIVGFAGLDDDEENLYGKFIALKRCRDAYWKIAGKEIGLGKPWEPDWNAPNKTYYTIIVKGNEIYKSQAHKFNEIFAFPIEEMRDAFKENFDADLELCKEFL